MTTQVTEVVDSGVLISESLQDGSDSTLSTCDSQHYIQGKRSTQIFAEEFDKVLFENKLLEKCSED